MKNIFIPLAFLLLLSSCSGKIIQSSSTIEKDSVFVDTVHHKKIIKEKGDSVGAVIQLPQTLINRTKTLTSPKEEEVISFTAEDPIVFKQEVKKGRLTESVTIHKKEN